jgi:hypothetical protein
LKKLSSGRIDMSDETTATPDNTAVRVALWRALHLQVDPPPPVLEMEFIDPAVRPGFEMAEKGARANGTPFLSFFTPTVMMATLTSYHY